MAARTRRTYAAVVTAHVARAAMSGDKTLAELAQRVEVPPTQMTEWKRPLSERATEIFGGGAASAEPPVARKAVHATMGPRTLEHDFGEKERASRWEGCARGRSGSDASPGRVAPGAPVHGRAYAARPTESGEGRRGTYTRGHGDDAHGQGGARSNAGHPHETPRP